MTLKQTLADLKAAGTAQNRKVYARHGVTGPCHGVSYAHLRALKKRLGTDHALAAGLWATGNHDARVLATMVADPDACGARDLDAWARDLDSYVLTDAFSALVARTPHARRKVDVWHRRRAEHVSSAAYNVLAALAVDQAAPLDEAWLADHLARIAREIHDRPDRTRHSMNQALIAIGARGGRLEKAALAAARRIGKVEVDHGETGCRTPDAAAYIARTRAHRARGRARA